MKPRAQNLRKCATPQENTLWYQFLRTHPIPFARQKTVGEYIVDFLCPSRKLVIEVDGKQHYTAEGLEYDALRTESLESLGLRVLRFTNDEIDSSFHEVCGVIQRDLDAENKTPGPAGPPSLLKRVR
jgi:very-short-patch-repair endonuclease